MGVGFRTWSRRCSVAIVGSGAAVLLSVRSPSTQCDEVASAEVDLVTYNVLSPPLSRASHFPKNNPEDCDPTNRLPKIIERLEAAAASGTVIALQEVDLQWAGKFHAFFAERDYCCVFGQYGKPFNGYMGVMLAWPRNKYETVDVEISRVSDTAPKGAWPKDRHDAVPRYGTLTREELKEVLGGYVPEMQAVYDEWKVARDRFNEAVFVRLRPRTSPKSCFVVSTYHMPCLFGSAEKKRTVNIHTCLLLRRLCQFAKGDPAVLLGDFNFQPGSSSYQLVVGGGAVEAAANFPEEIEGLRERLPQGGEPSKSFESAYRSFHGNEPAFTNFSQTSGQREPFVSTLDYIWFTPDHFDVTACPKLPSSTEEVDGLFPSRCEPSDHLPVFATLRLR